MQQLKGGTNVLASVVKKKVIAATVSVLSKEAFPTVALALQVEVPMVADSITDPKVVECWNSGLDGRLEAKVARIQREAAVIATSESNRLLATLPTASHCRWLHEKNEWMRKWR
jgi:hypothetical protein